MYALGCPGSLPCSCSFWSSGCAASCDAVVARDELDARGEVDVALTGDDVVRRDLDRVEAGGAVARHGRPVGLLAELLAQEHRDAGDVVGLQPLGEAAAGDDLLHGGRVDAGVALEHLVEDVREGLVGSQRRERALEGAADRGADRVDDHGFGHGWVLSVMTPGGRTPRAGLSPGGRTPRGLSTRILVHAGPRARCAPSPRMPGVGPPCTPRPVWASRIVAAAALALAAPRTRAPRTGAPRSTTRPARLPAATVAARERFRRRAVDRAGVAATVDLCGRRLEPGRGLGGGRAPRHVRRTDAPRGLHRAAPAPSSGTSPATTTSPHCARRPLRQGYEHDQGPPASARPAGGRGGPGAPGGWHVGANGKREQALSASVAAKVKAAALAKVSGGAVERVETDVDHGSPYEAHVRKADGTQLEVLVNESFQVTAVTTMGR